MSQLQKEKISNFVKESGLDLHSSSKDIQNSRNVTILKEKMFSILKTDPTLAETRKPILIAEKGDSKEKHSDEYWLRQYITKQENNSAHGDITMLMLFAHEFGFGLSKTDIIRTTNNGVRAENRSRSQDLVAAQPGMPTLRVEHITSHILKDGKEIDRPSQHFEAIAMRKSDGNDVMFKKDKIDEPTDEHTKPDGNCMWNAMLQALQKGAHILQVQPTVQVARQVSEVSEPVVRATQPSPDSKTSYREMLQLLFTNETYENVVDRIIQSQGERHTHFSDEPNDTTKNTRDELLAIRNNPIQKDSVKQQISEDRALAILLAQEEMQILDNSARACP